MEITLSPADLKAALSAVAHAVPKRTILTILECILIEVIEGKVTITATDMENTVTVPIAAQLSLLDDYAIALPYELLTKVATNLPNHEPVCLEFNTDFICHVSQGSTSNYKFPGQDPAEYPKPEIADALHTASVPFGKLRSAYKEASGFTIGSDSFQLALTGIYTVLSPEQGASEIVATNGHWLYRNELGGCVASCDTEFSFILPVRAAQLICKQEFDADAYIGIALLHNGKCLFDFVSESGVTTSTIVCQLVDAKYVQYKNVIPDIGNAHTCIDFENHGGMKDMLKRLITTADQAQFALTVSYTPGQECVFLSQSAERGTSGLEKLTTMEEDSKRTYQPFTICLNSKLFLGCIEAFSGDDQLRFYYFAENKPVLLKSEENGSVTVLLMPIMPLK